MLAREEYGRSRSYFEMMEQAARDADDRYRLAAALGNLGVVALYEGEGERALAQIDESLQLARELGIDEHVVHNLTNAGQAAMSLGQYEQVRKLLDESAEICVRRGYIPSLASTLALLGAVLAAQGHWERAVKLLGTAQELDRRSGTCSTRTSKQSGIARSSKPVPASRSKHSRRPGRPDGKRVRPGSSPRDSPPWTDGDTTVCRATHRRCRLLRATRPGRAGARRALDSDLRGR
jgi:tetratricopeptide (TPR) repeat protein